KIDKRGGEAPHNENPEAQDAPKDTPLRKAAREVRGIGSANGRWVELVFGERRTADNDRVVVFHHIRKTAGTSLKQVIKRNVPGGKIVQLVYPAGSVQELRAWWQELFASMTPGERAALWAVSSHTAGFCHDLLAPRAIGITMVR